MTRKTRYQIYGILFQSVCLIANFSALFFLALVMHDVLVDGWEGLSFDFLTGYPSRKPENAGILPAIVGTIYMMLLTAFIAIPTGVGAAIFLEEYSQKALFINFVKLNIQNLAGVPSIVYGILGLTLFVRGFDLEIAGFSLGMGRSLLAGSLTMALVILPIITISTQEALRAVPESFRLAGFGIGMTRWQVIRYQVLPVAMPGILTGVILSLSRAIGESAPLLMIGALAFVAFLPANPMDSFTVLPIQIFNWASRPQKGFHDAAASAIIVLMLLLLIMNAISIIMRAYYNSKLRDLKN
ncbi:MAG: phosphate ABC transporter permease PstA [Spirochaetia bacterium]|nr:phosphate ABC transporter permease PstA [Spirochaetia bacterium]